MSTEFRPSGVTAQAIARPGRLARGLHAVERFGLFVLLFVLIAVFSSLRPDTFATTANLRNVLANQAVLGVVALASMVPLIGGQFDLSVGSVLGLASLVTAKLTADAGWPLLLAIIASVAVGAVIGLANGLLVARARISALVATLGVSTILTGVAFNLTGGLSIVDGIPDGLAVFGARRVVGVPAPTIVLAVVTVAVWYVVTQTPFGRRLHAVGVSADAARLVGIDVSRHVVISFVLSGALAAVAGVMVIGATGSANPQAGPNYLLPALSAAFLGATTVTPGRFNVVGTVLAVYFLATTINGLTFLGFSSDLEAVFNGAALISAVGLSVFLTRRRTAA